MDILQKRFTQAIREAAAARPFPREDQDYQKHVWNLHHRLQQAINAAKCVEVQVALFDDAADWRTSRTMSPEYACRRNSAFHDWMRTCMCMHAAGRSRMFVSGWGRLCRILSKEEALTCFDWDDVVPLACRTLFHEKQWEALWHSHQLNPHLEPLNFKHFDVDAAWGAALLTHNTAMFKAARKVHRRVALTQESCEEIRKILSSFPDTLLIPETRQAVQTVPDHSQAIGDAELSPFREALWNVYRQTKDRKLGSLLDAAAEVRPIPWSIVELLLDENVSMRHATMMTFRSQAETAAAASHCDQDEKVTLLRIIKTLSKHPMLQKQDEPTTVPSSPPPKEPPSSLQSSRCVIC